MITIRDFFAPGGPLAATIPGYERRGEQVRMAEAVENALASGSPLLADAPTGTGKGQAYLVPAVLSGQKVLISTASKVLQDQLVKKDVPALRQALLRAGVEPPSYALVKGRPDFLCQRRFGEFLEEPSAWADTETLEALTEWRNVTTSGDVEMLPEGLTKPPFWAEIAADPDDCHRKTCPFAEECFYFKQKDRATEASILVLNHALLCANIASGGAIFDMTERHLIIDEGHALEGYVSRFFGARVTLRRVKRAVKAIERKTTDLIEYVADAQECAEHFFDDLEGMDRSQLNDPDLAPNTYAPLVRSLEALGRRAANNPAEEVNKLAGALERLVADLRSFFEPALDSHAYDVKDGVLQSWLVDTGELFRDGVIRPARANGKGVVATSATLAVGGSFEYPKRRLGFEGAVEYQGREIFDYQNNAMIYCGVDLPSPQGRGADDHTRACLRRAAELVNASEGRALILLATHKALRAFRESFSEAVDYPVCYQGDDSPGRLAEWLRQAGGVLVGTKSFWAGVDIPGAALSLVVIDKIPFPRPDDPVIEKLTERAGKRWFVEVSLPAALLDTRQGAGRLLRTHSDRGVIAILDPRLSSKPWAKSVLASLPRSAPRTSDVRDVAAFFDEGEEAA